MPKQQFRPLKIEGNADMCPKVGKDREVPRLLLNRAQKYES